MDKKFKIKMNDYGIYNEIYRGLKKSASSDINSTSKTPSMSSNKSSSRPGDNDNKIERTPKMSFVEGLRVDVYFLGIVILKILGKMRIEEGDKLNMTSLL
mmetsp:Transcript_4105/g.3865  ORF Transcript_4105/g.3865 Transcript_4105/m.3865 type:complete len:100 (-) Transcript_4105:7-306(-)